jgi:HAD superfamily hydrolase (TIGR01509 family)
VIETVVVDLGGVAARFRPERRLQALSSLSGVAQGLIQERLFDSGFESQSELGAYSPDQVVAAVQAALDHRAPVTALIDAWALAFEPDADVLNCIASSPVRRALFTNNGPMIDACLAGPLRGLAAAFSEIICSWHIRARKPEPAAFERAAGRLGCSPDRLLLLDDSAENVEAAILCGWDADCVTGLPDVVEALGRRQGLHSQPV